MLLAGVYRPSIEKKPFSMEEIIEFNEIFRKKNIEWIILDDTSLVLEHENSIQGWRLSKEKNTLLLNECAIPDFIINESNLSYLTDKGIELEKKIIFDRIPLPEGKEILRDLEDSLKYSEFVSRSLIENYRVRAYSRKVVGWEILSLDIYLKERQEWIDFEEFSYEINDEKQARFLRFYISELSKDLSVEIEDLRNEEFNELILEYIVDVDQKIEVVNITDDVIPYLANKSERISYVVDYALEAYKKKVVNQPITIGMLVKTERNPGIFKKFNNMKFSCAAVAGIRKLNFFFFTPEDIDTEKKKIKAYVYNNKGNKKRFWRNYPDVIIDRFKTRGDEEYEWLYEEFKDIPFNNERQGGAMSKLEAYSLLEKSPRYKELLIPYETYTSSDQLHKFITTHEQIIIKPNKGSFGDNILFLNYSGDDSVEYQLDDQQGTVSFEKLNEWISLEEEDIVLQKFIKSQTIAGEPFDVRIHVLKNGEGKWRIANIYPRKGNIDGVTSNLSGGGSTSTWAQFFNNEFPEYEWKRFNSMLMDFSIEFAEYFQEQLSERVNEIAIDIGIDRNDMNLYLFEINANIPGARFHTLEAAYYIVSYAEYLVKEYRRQLIESMVSDIEESELPSF